MRSYSSSLFVKARVARSLSVSVNYSVFSASKAVHKRLKDTDKASAMAKNLDLLDAPFSEEQREWLTRLFSQQEQQSSSSTLSEEGENPNPPRSKDPPTGKLVTE